MWGHEDAVLALSVSEHNILASAGYDGIRVWQLPTGTPILAPHADSALRGTVSALTWVPVAHDCDVLLYGTASGYLGSWLKREGCDTAEEGFGRCIGNGGEITSLTTTKDNDGSFLVAVAALDGILQVWLLRGDNSMEGKFSLQLDIVPRALCFSTDGTTLRVFGLRCGSILILQSGSGDLLTRQVIGRSIIGGVAVNPCQSSFVVDNTWDGLDLFELSNCHWVRSFLTNETKFRYPKQVAFAENGRAVVGGDEDGNIYVFDTTSGSELSVLQHSKGASVYTITTSSFGGSSWIIAADSTEGKASFISSESAPFAGR
ncbi:WD40 repeat-like protein [Stereum hirsutum FP-91666 SS1]|uniref:WD40 repeat-like protein n=1 Tax=Stereum hirsutum (strain FP-91666) TaxID=721885 RepID=R7RY84_STEHR|nr:WD40 repeat-like protein [Stereum hirsutum FP-91666 SS1]EIM79768.1 WD40 repeat-like protein [Stereum hirsutum FP-91666 SS1]